MAAPAVLSGQSSAAGPLDFLGLRPGASRVEIEAGLAEARGSWQCRRSAVDRRFAECLGTLEDPAGAMLTITGSLVHDSAAVLLLRRVTTAATAASWLQHLATRFGVVAPKRDRGQETWQWVRRGRMIRLTTRVESGAVALSVSLVDGRLLDGLGPLPPRHQ